MTGLKPDLETAKYQLELNLLRLTQAAEGNCLHLRLTLPDRIHQFEQLPGTVTCEVKYHKLIVLFWGESYAQSWQVVSFTSALNRIEIQISRHSGHLTGLLLIQIDPADSLPILAHPRRTEFHDRLLKLIKRTFPSVHIHRASARQSPTGQRSVYFSRIWITAQTNQWVAIGINPGELKPAQHQVVAAVLEMATELLKTGVPITRALIFAPRVCIEHICRQITMIRGLKLELFELDATCTAARPISFPPDQPALFTGPVNQFFEASGGAIPPLTEDERDQLNRIVDLSPTTITSCHSLSHPWISIRWNGLEFARLVRETPVSPAQLRFGISALHHPLRQLTSASHKRFANLVQLLGKHRTGQPVDHRHPLYRLQAERWLESIVQREISHLDSSLQPHTVAEQVAAFNLTDGGFVDLLGVRENGQLAILELKASADPQHLWQGLEYWYRVQNHLHRGDIHRHPAFAQLNISRSLPPVLCLIAPMLDLHPTTQDSLSWIDPAVPIQIIGIGQQWRQSLKVIFRKSNQ
ncbi:MAG: hypothetical protein HY774_17930 [Acidobacteria bacterium]|nr:hypothetical protein [Acidobacteriota bacterium]